MPSEGSKSMDMEKERERGIERKMYRWASKCVIELNGQGDWMLMMGIPHKV